MYLVWFLLGCWFGYVVSFWVFLFWWCSQEEKKR